MATSLIDSVVKLTWTEEAVQSYALAKSAGNNTPTLPALNAIIQVISGPVYLNSNNEEGTDGILLQTGTIINLNGKVEEDTIYIYANDGADVRIAITNSI